MQVESQVRFIDHTAAVQTAVQKANFTSFSHAAASIRKDAANSLIRKGRSTDHSPPGSPPHTHKGVFLKRSIRYSLLKNSSGKTTGAVIGTLHSIVGDVGHVHEFGGRRGVATYPARPFMRPALDRQSTRLAAHWQGTIGG